MNRTIWKFELKLTDVQKVRMRKGAQLLYVGNQGGTHPTLWALVDTRAPEVERLIAVVGTGNPAPDPEDHAVYVGSAVCGPFVWHIFDGGEVE